MSVTSNETCTRTFAAGSMSSPESGPSRLAGPVPSTAARITRSASSSQRSKLNSSYCVTSLPSKKLSPSNACSVWMGAGERPVARLDAVDRLARAVDPVELVGVRAEREELRVGGREVGADLVARDL